MLKMLQIDFSEQALSKTRAYEWYSETFLNRNRKRPTKMLGSGRFPAYGDRFPYKSGFRFESFEETGNTSIK